MYLPTCSECGERYAEDIETCPDCNEPLESEGAEVYEWWIVSDWLYRRLKEQGEVVCDDFHGLTIWGRQTTGQAIYMDYVISQIFDLPEKIA